MTKLSKDELINILTEHKLWLESSGAKGNKADLSYANLRNANLSNANLRGADLINADLSYANLRNASLSNANLDYANLSCSDLSYADLRHANLFRADLSYADLSNANLYFADLRSANLIEANLSNADLESADISYADLRYANLISSDLRFSSLRHANLSSAILKSTLLPPFKIIPEKGAFIAYKKLANRVVAEIEITAKSKRVSCLTSRKCRASEIKILRFINSRKKKEYNKGDGESIQTLYEVGKTYKVKNFDEDIRIECTKGIHFFITKKEAEEYI